MKPWPPLRLYIGFSTTNSLSMTGSVDGFQLLGEWVKSVENVADDGHAAQRSSAKLLLNGIAFLVATWLALIFTMLALQHLNGRFGFHLWWLGETRIWLNFLQALPTEEVPRAFWKMDSRNPLSPWWYLAFRHQILATPPIFLILHLLTSLLTGIAVFWTFSEATEYRATRFAAVAGALTSINIANGRIDEIHWEYVGALGFTFLAVASFSRYLNSGRRDGIWFVWSLVFWSVAFGTYTIQSGAVFAIGLLCLSYAKNPRDVLRAATDTLPYFAILILFVLIWKTTSAFLVVDSATAPTVSAIAATLWRGIWHQDNAFLFDWASQIGWRSAMVAITITAVSGAAASWLFIREDQSASLEWIDAGRIVAIAIGVAFPTVAVESTSAMHPPGSRWEFLQYWYPTVAALLLMLLLQTAIRSARHRKAAWNVAYITLTAGIVLSALGYNQFQVKATTAERQFMVGLRAVASAEKSAGLPFPRHYIVKRQPLWTPSSRVPYGPTEFRDIGTVTFRFTDDPVPSPGYETVFEEDKLVNPELLSLGETPYANVSVLEYTSEGFHKVWNADSKFFDGSTVVWRRRSPLP